MNQVPIVQERQPARRIAIYSHKGGVGKTILTTNIAFALAHLQKRVLLIDSDPQCNLSAYLIDSDGLDRLLDQSDSKEGKTAWSTLRWALENPEKPVAIEPIERPRGLLLLPGDIRMSEFEEALHLSWRKCKERELSAFAATTSLSLVVNSICSKYGIEFVFYDCGPNIGPLNRVILLDCDYFIIPSACDEFSIRAIRTVGYTLVRWISQWSDIADLAPDGTYLLQGRPRFLGYVAQQFRVYGGEPSQEFRSFLARIDQHIAQDVVAQLSRSLVPSRTEGFQLGQVQNLASLVPAAQRTGSPLWEVNAGSPDLRATAKTAFFGMADRILKQTSKDSKANG